MVMRPREIDILGEKASATRSANSVNEPSFRLCSTEGTWGIVALYGGYRARVISIVSKGRVTIFAIDYFLKGLVRIKLIFVAL